MNRPRYSKYTSPNIPWVGDVPAQWDVARSDNYVTTERRQLDPQHFASREVFHYSIPLVQETGTGAIEDGESISSAKQIISEPVLLVSKLNPRKATVCIAHPTDRLTLCSTEFVVLKPVSADLKFLYYLALTEPFRQRLDAAVQSVTRSHQRASPEQIYRFWAAWPSLEEQVAIAGFLDTKSATIDTLIADKLRLIERLREKRHSLISHVVTRGLPPNAARVAGLNDRPRLTASASACIGKVPEHWRVGRLKHFLIRIEQGWSPECHSYPADPGEWGVLKAGCCNRGRFNAGENKALPSALDPVPDLEIRPGQLLMSRASGSAELIGSSALVPPDCPTRLILSDKLYRLTTRCERLKPPFAAYLLQSAVGRDQVLRVISGSAGLAKNIGQDDVRDFLIPVPPTAEQEAIVAYLDRETSGLDRLIQSVEVAITSLNEYRSALITAAATGKIDVRRVEAEAESAEVLA